MSFLINRDILIQHQANRSFGSQNIKESIPEKSLDASLENNHHRYHDHYEHGQLETLALSSEHHAGTNSSYDTRLKQFLPAIFIFVALGSLLAWSCIDGMNAWEPGVDLFGRALGDNSTSIQIRSEGSNNFTWIGQLTLTYLVIPSPI